MGESPWKFESSRPHQTPCFRLQPLGFILTGGEASDYGAVDALMALPVTTPKALLADKGYDGDAVRASLLIRGILPIIPPWTNRRDTIACDFRRYPLARDWR